MGVEYLFNDDTTQAMSNEYQWACSLSFKLAIMSLNPFADREKTYRILSSPIAQG